jgi:hypothetical protein
VVGLRPLGEGSRRQNGELDESIHTPISKTTTTTEQAVRQEGTDKVKTTVCDICYKLDKKKLTETVKYMNIKGFSELRVDYCEGCKDRIPKKLIDYIKFVFSLDGINQTDEDIKRMYGSRMRLG